MGTARGKLADMVLYRRGGEQISRVRIRRIANPRTEAQLTNRVVVSTLSKRYAVLKALSDHGFQGFSTPAQNMAEFMKQNSSMVQSDIVAARKDSTAWAGSLYNFNGRNDFDALIGKTIVAKGTLPEVGASFSVLSGHAGIILTDTNGLAATATYGDVAAKLGASMGDQITLCFVVGDATKGIMRAIEVRRFILQPKTGDETTLFISDGAINDANVLNEMEGVALDVVQGEGIRFVLTSLPDTDVVGIVAIRSRYAAGQWERSLSYLTVVSQFQAKTMRLAIDSWNEDIASSKYLNKGEGTAFT